MLGYLSNKVNMCDTFGMICYEKAFANATKDMNLKGSCYESCKNVKYSLILLENSPVDNVASNMDKYGEEFKKYVFNQSRIHPYLGFYRYSSNMEKYYIERRLQRTSIIHINFGESKVLTVIKDAKITLSDMVGNIGGTLGVFIGFSFLGLLDTFIELMHYLQEKIRSMRPKSSSPL